jgi:hypothetical protein
MPRAFTSADVVQSDPGTALSATNPGIALPNPAVGGNGGVVLLAAAGVIEKPEQWDMVIGVGLTDTSTPQLMILCRADLPDADQSWTFLPVGGAGVTNWAWVAEEWTNLSYAPLLATAFTGATTAPTSISSGTTGTWDWPYAVGIAVVSLVHGTSGAFTWPSSVSWSNGFTETDVVTLGSGGTALDTQLRVARKYGTLSDAGGWETTALFTDATTNKTVRACIAVFRAEDQVEVPAASVMTS